MRPTRKAGYGVMAAAALVVAACGGENEAAARVSLAETTSDIAAEANAAPASDLPLVTVYKSPACACCAKWVEHMRAAGFEVKVVDDNDRLYEAKRRHAIGPGHTSCHTAEVGGYFVEGHVPAADIQRLLAEAPSEIAGLAVPGMPMGSPGMEGPRKDDYDVVAIERSGGTTVYASH